MGSTLAARVAGRHTASNAAATRMNGADRKTAGSQGLTPNRNADGRRVMATQLYSYRPYKPGDLACIRGDMLLPSLTSSGSPSSPKRVQPDSSKPRNISTYCRGRDQPSDAEGASAPETLRQKDHDRANIWREASWLKLADGITFSGKKDRWGVQHLESHDEGVVCRDVPTGSIAVQIRSGVRFVAEESAELHGWVIPRPPHQS